MAIDITGESGHIVTRATASGTPLADMTTPAATRYPVISFDVTVSSGTCSANPLDGSGSGVTTGYTSFATPEDFDNYYGSTGSGERVVAGMTAASAGLSCNQLKLAGANASGVYWVDPDGAGGTAPFQAYCDMVTNGGGWLLAGKVNTADTSISEPRTWFTATTNASDMLSPNMTKNAGMASLGTARLVPLIGAGTLARVVVIAEDDSTQTGTWFKRVASATSFSGWFDQDPTPSQVCTDVAMTANCTNGIIGQTSGMTLLGGMNLATFGYPANGELHMRLDGDSMSGFNAVCSYTFNNSGNAWHDSSDDGHWGNGLLVWIR